MGNRTIYVEQVVLSQEVSLEVSREAERRGVSRSAVVREATEWFLGFRGEGKGEVSDRVREPSQNHGRK